jgi:hypothetical protein
VHLLVTVQNKGRQWDVPTLQFSTILLMLLCPEVSRVVNFLFVGV